MDDNTDAVPSWLTDEEHRALALTAELANLFGRITGQDRSRHNDLGEAVHHIHALQHMVMAQAAGRAYPSLYRLMGEILA